MKAEARGQEEPLVIRDAATGGGKHVENKTGRVKGDLQVRTKQFAIRIIRLYSALPRRTEAQIIGRQVLRSGTSVGAHYREAQRAKSAADFVSKLEGALQELDETSYWLELLGDSKLVASERLQALRTECDELIAIFVTIVKRTKMNKRV